MGLGKRAESTITNFMSSADSDEYMDKNHLDISPSHISIDE